MSDTSYIWDLFVCFVGISNLTSFPAFIVFLSTAQWAVIVPKPPKDSEWQAQSHHNIEPT